MKPPHTPAWVRWLPAIMLMLVIFIFSAIPDAGLQTQFSPDPVKIPNFGVANRVVKKLGHLLIYALLARCYLYGLGKHDRRTRWIAFGLAVLYGISDEFHQSFVPGRGAGPVDVFIDACGAWLALFLPKIIKRRNKFESINFQHTNE
ncbi:MAG: VanZ family protein [Anaerolineales bacterium]|nr:VanZ family protein [Anaerolineales bacterium]